jgi:low affinity Fe/Cu permease
MNEAFSKLAARTANAIGSPIAFLVALGVTLIWAICGPFFGFSDTWQLIINTASTISTGLIVFLIQGSQNKDTAAIQRKLDELIRAVDKADNKVAGIEKE